MSDITYSFHFTMKPSRNGYTPVHFSHSSNSLAKRRSHQSRALSSERESAVPHKKAAEAANVHAHIQSSTLHCNCCDLVQYCIEASTDANHVDPTKHQTECWHFSQIRELYPVTLTLGVVWHTFYIRLTNTPATQDNKGFSCVNIVHYSDRNHVFTLSSIRDS
jgi:hypothetical protein